MLRIAICDDSLPLTTEVENLLLNIEKQEHIRMEIDVFFDGKTLYQEIQSGTNYDIIYMDIEMKDIDGIRAAHLIRSIKSPTILIYISAYDTYFKQLFEVEPFRFISKPIDTTLFKKYFFEAYNKINAQIQYFTFGFHHKYTKVPIADIFYFESCGRDIFIHTPAKTYRFLSRLDDIERKLVHDNVDFLRIHQSFLINPAYIHSITFTTVEMMAQRIFRIGPKFQANVRKQYFKILEDV